MTFLFVRSQQVPRGPCVATIGNFDGLHVGHQRIIQRVVARAKECQGIPTVITFEPLPQTVLRPEQPFFRLITLRQKLSLLRQWGIQQVIGLRFNENLARLSPQTFIESFLVKKFQLKYLIVGENFRFGHQQQGQVSTLQEAAAHYGFIVEPQSLLAQEDKRVSSTRIRQALLAGDVPTANSLLGRDFSLAGRVVHGAMRGRQLGFPTANLGLNAPSEFKGVFLTQVRWEDKTAMGVANLGTRPTVDGKRHTVEVHILNFSGDLYGKRLELAFLHKIRDEMRFADIKQLQQRISQDVQEALTIYDRV